MEPEVANTMALADVPVERSTMQKMIKTAKNLFISVNPTNLSLVNYLVNYM